MDKGVLLKLLRRVVMVSIGSAVLGTVLLVLIFCIPTDRIKSHIEASLEQMIPTEEALSARSPLAQYIRNGRVSFTDAIMVQNAAEKVEGRNAFEHAMWIYHHDLSQDTWTPELSLSDYVRDENVEGMFLHNYARYWHGYLVFLKPLLFFFTWSQVTVIAVVLQVLLLLLVLLLSLRRKAYGVFPALLGGMLFMKPVLMMTSLSMSICWIITLAAISLILVFHEKMEQDNWYPVFFFSLGIAVAYFDFLTYPIVPLGFALCVFFLIKKRENPGGQLAEVVGLPVCWGVGYACFWAGKWVLAEVTLRSGTIKDAASSLFGWSDVVGGRPRLNGSLYTLGLLLQEYQSVFYPIAAGLLAAVALVLLILAFVRIKPLKLLNALLPFAVVFFGPLAWLLVVQHHSALHTSFTFRMLSVSAVAVSCIGIKLAELLLEEKRGKNQGK